MGDLNNDPLMRNQNAVVQARTKAQNRANVLQLKLIGQNHPNGLTANLLKLFEPRPPLEYKPPPGEKKMSTAYRDGAICEQVTFPELETLAIRYMNRWNSIWHNQQAPNSFCKLNKVEITGCDALHHVFPIAMLKELQQLQVLEISTANIENTVEENNSHDVEQGFLCTL
ncbi:unnamed protein product [Sphenostylis stenocarpa]|uniref:Uncharacterized protein n=1 Tax=Sphenostylis stenocarpa TaxID=92480 RepID=A0AA86SGL6_9FABA|nr:unnamed protein product [Sphenostylis stenocarpa]